MNPVVHAQLYHLQSVVSQPPQATTPVFQSGRNTFALVRGKTYILGRSPKSIRKRKAQSNGNVELPDLVKLYDSQRVLSRVHAKIEFYHEGNVFILTDLSSAKRVTVNGVSVPTPDGIELKNGDLVCLSRKGNYEFVFVVCNQRTDVHIQASEEVSPVSGEPTRTPKRMKTSEESEEGESPLDKAIARLENVAARLEEKQSQKSETVAEGDAKAKPEEAKVEACTFAADETDLKEEIKRELSCCLCNDLMRVPTILPCSHGFCKICVQQWLYKRAEQGKSAACPTCKKKCLPKAGSGKARIMCHSVQLENVVAKFTREKPPAAVESTGQEFHELFDYDDATSEESSHSSPELEEASALCDFCGEDAHEDGHCPHRASDDANSGRESE